MKNTRKKIIPDRVFHKLWDNASDYSDYKEFARDSLQKNGVFSGYKKQGMDYVQASEACKSIYIAKKEMDFKAILTKANKRKCDISHLFCIPIRTIEDWYSAKSKCPDYMRLMMLEYFDMLNLPKYIYREKTDNENEYKHKIYETNKNTKDETPVIKVDKNVDDSSNADLEYIDRILKQIEQKQSKVDFSASKNIIKETDYLGNILKRRNQS